MNKKLNKFYLGAQHIANDIANGRNNSHTHPTLDAAIRDAKLRVEGGEEVVTIVKIVAIVKRKETPVVVEIVR
jgi:hypothetical protein